MRRLIVNADDFGLSEGVNRGIVEAHRDGIVTSTTLMANGPAFAHAAALARENPALAIGVHLVLVGGTSVAPPDEVEGLVDSEGRLPRRPPVLQARLVARRVPRRALEREVEAQIRKVRQAGIEPTHVDGHKHAHVFPAAARAIATAAARLGLERVRIPIESPLRSSVGTPARRSNRLDPLLTECHARLSRGIYRRAGFRTADHFLGMRWSGHLRAQSVLFLLGAVREGTTEIMCHPGYSDPTLERLSSFTRVREEELAALTDPAVVKSLGTLGIEGATYRDV